MPSKRSSGLKPFATEEITSNALSTDVGHRRIAEHEHHHLQFLEGRKRIATGWKLCPH